MRRLQPFALLAFALCLPACERDLETARCPCLAGWICCATQDRCVETAAECTADDQAQPPVDISAFAGSWGGLVDEYSFISGSSRVRLDMDESGSGTLLVGEREPLAAPTDPDMGYPPTAFEGSYLKLGLFDGVLYPVHATLTAKQLHFQFSLMDAFSDWCGIQTPMPDPSGGYGCLPKFGVTFRTQETCGYSLPGEPEQPVACSKVDLCVKRHVCQCDATSCESVRESNVTVTASFNSQEELDGSLLVPEDEEMVSNHSLHLVAVR
jgi:hypothetical protein